MHRTQRSASPQTTKSDITQDDDGTGHAITVNYFIVNVIVAKLETKIKITQDLNAITGAAEHEVSWLITRMLLPGGRQ